jgi:uncharacterized tellurite resistance protein B-like protein
MHNPYAPPTESSPAIVDRYPNDSMNVDRGKVTGAGVTLIIIGALQLVAGLALYSGALGHIPNIKIIGIGAAIEGVLNILLGILTLKNSYPAAVIGLVLNSLALLVTLLSLNIIGIAIRGAAVAVIARGVGALKGINNRIAEPVQQNPLTAYYHHLIPLLVRVIGADGHLDRRERGKIAVICNAMQISRYEEHRLVNAATKQGGTLDIRDAVDKYLTRARTIQLPNPEHQLITAAIAVAGADGVIVAEEEQVIYQIGDALRLSREDVAARLAAHRAKLDHLDINMAREILNVTANALPEEIEASYNTIKSEMQPQNYAHLGSNLGDYVNQRAAILEKAVQLLRSTAP